MAVLKVLLKKMTNLADKDLFGKSDPFVKFNLEQDNLIFDKNFGDKKSSVKKDNLNPVYNEMFQWEIPSNLGMKNMVLRCTVMDKDPLISDKMGFCKIDLDDLDLGPEPLGLDRVVDHNLLTKHGRIFLEISYHA